MIAGIVASGRSAIATPGLPTVIGQAYGGGYYVGDITISSVTYALISATSSQGISAQWKTANTTTAGTTINNGLANTAALIAAGAAAHPAAKHCDDFTHEGFTDWYLPARDELAVIMASRATLTPIIGLGTRWWSSYQSASSTAWTRDTYSGGVAFAYNKTTSYRAVPMRRELRL